ncbi:MAG: adenylate kinase-domain-containing protein [Linnemannia gamsii]|nr:MAG: adenylate kinase-domain-containing protein [Linnemannia gamsii]
MVEGYSPLRLLLIGSPGAGKGTQSGRIQNNFEVSTISSGDLLRKNIAQGTDIGKRAAKEMKNGAFVSDEVMVKLIDSELAKLGAEQGWLLDGFPRTMTQAQALDHTLESLSQPLNLVIHLNVPEEVILQRIMDRWVHIPSGRVYNMTYNPPKRAGLDDVTGEPLERRPDDNPETFKIRLQKHHELTEPLLDYYKNKNILVSLAGNTSDEIYPQIRELLQTRFKPEDASEVAGQGQA